MGVLWKKNYPPVRGFYRIRRSLAHIAESRYLLAFSIVLEHRTIAFLGHKTLKS